MPASTAFHKLMFEIFLKMKKTEKCLPPLHKFKKCKYSYWHGCQCFIVSDTDANALAWLWLRENNIPPCGAKDNTASDQAWSLLQSYLTLLEDGSGVCHKCVAHTLLSQSFHLPTWLVHSYKVWGNFLKFDYLYTFLLLCIIDYISIFIFIGILTNSLWWVKYIVPESGCCCFAKSVFELWPVKSSSFSSNWVPGCCHKFVERNWWTTI